MKRSLLILSLIVAVVVWFVWGALREANRPAGYYYEQAQQAIASGNNEEAVSQLRTALIKDPDHIRSRWQLATLYMEAGRSWAALTHLERLQKHDPGPDVEFARARALVALGRHEEMLALTEAVDDSAQAFELMNLRARSLVKLERLGEAADVYRSPGLINTDAAILGLAEIALLRRDTAAARSHLAPLLKPGKDNRKAQLLQAETFLLDGNYAAAEDAFASLLIVWPENSRATIGLIRSNIAAGHINQATRNVSKLRELAPIHPEVNYLRGRLAEHAGDFERAKIRYQRVLRLLPGHYESSLRLGEIFYSEQKYATAQSHFRSAIEGAPHSREAFIGLARAQRDAGRLRAASETLRRLIEVEPSATIGHFELAIVLEADGDIAGSRRALQKVLEIEPDHQGAMTKLNN